MAVAVVLVWILVVVVVVVVVAADSRYSSGQRRTAPSDGEGFIIHGPERGQFFTTLFYLDGHFPATKQQNLVAPDTQSQRCGPSFLLFLLEGSKQCSTLSNTQNL